jgi:hypothetical protein
MSSRIARSFLIVLVAASLASAAGPAQVTTPDEDGTEPASQSCSPTVTDLMFYDEGASEPMDQSCDAAGTLDFSLASDAQDIESLLDGIVVNETAAGSCKPCKGRTWCKCTYNGLPRVSCNPCCYGNLGIPQVCLD